MLLVAALDGEPLVVSGREAARQHAARLVAAAGPDAAYAIARGADAVRAALLAAGVRGERIVDVPVVIGCDDAAFLRANVAGATSVQHAAELIASASPGQVWLTVAGAVVAPGARFVDASARVSDVVAAAGGVTCGPAWVALGSFLHVRPPFERDARVGDLGAGRALLIAPGGSTLARRARGDLRALDVASPLGVDRAWLGAFDANAAARAPLSIALVSQRLGFAPGQLSWPELE